MGSANLGQDAVERLAVVLRPGRRGEREQQGDQSQENAGTHGFFRFPPMNLA